MSEPTAVHRYVLPARAQTAEVVAAQLWAAGATGVWERPGELVAWFVTDDPSTLVLPPGGRLEPEPARDWQAEWKATIRPVLAGRFAVVPSWLVDDHVPAGDETTLVLDPGQAFGSGHHATTALCLELLDRLDLDGRRVADVGCGTGILAIAAAARGADVLAVDVDADAVGVTRDNARRNAVELDAFVGSVDALTGPADVVVANLVTDVVVALADALVAATRAHLVVSGIAAERRHLAVDALTAAGATVVEVHERDGWLALLARPAAAAPGVAAASRRRGRVGLAGAALALAAFALTGAACTEPELAQEPALGTTADAEPAPVAVPEDDTLGEQLDLLLATLDAADAALTDAAAASDAAGVRRAADDALGLLLEDAGGTPDGLAPLFPGTERDRSVSGAGTDALTIALTAARDAGGPLGTRTVDVLRDPLAGDLGAWEREPQDVVAAVEATVADADDLTSLTDAVLDLPGDGTRALAWTLLAAEATDAQDGVLYAERARAHLGIVRVALDELRS